MKTKIPFPHVPKQFYSIKKIAAEIKKAIADSKYKPLEITWEEFESAVQHEYPESCEPIKEKLLKVALEVYQNIGIILVPTCEDEYGGIKHTLPPIIISKGKQENKGRNLLNYHRGWNTSIESFLEPFELTPLYNVILKKSTPKGLTPGFILLGNPRDKNPSYSHEIFEIVKGTEIIIDNTHTFSKENKFVSSKFASSLDAWATIQKLPYNTNAVQFYLSQRNSLLACVEPESTLYISLSKLDKREEELYRDGMKECFNHDKMSLKKTLKKIAVNIVTN